MLKQEEIKNIIGSINERIKDIRKIIDVMTARGIANESNEDFSRLMKNFDELNESLNNLNQKLYK